MQLLASLGYQSVNGFVTASCLVVHVQVAQISADSRISAAFRNLPDFRSNIAYSRRPICISSYYYYSISLSVPVSGADQRDVGEVSFIPALVAGKDGDAQDFGVCANEKVWQAVLARVKISRASASMDCPWLAACMRSFCFTGSSKLRMVKVVLTV